MKGNFNVQKRELSFSALDINFIYDINFRYKMLFVHNLQKVDGVLQMKKQQKYQQTFWYIISLKWIRQLSNESF